jgi:hypothetical protein
MNTYEDVDEVEDIESYDFWTELDPDEMLDMEDAAVRSFFHQIYLCPHCVSI